MKFLHTVLAIAAISTTALCREKYNARSDTRNPSSLSGFLVELQDTARVAIAKADEFLQTNDLVKDLQESTRAAFEKVDELYQTKVLASLPADVQTFFHQKATSLHDTVVSVKWDDLPKDVRQHIQEYIQEHPYQTALLVVEGVVYFTPAGVSSGLLNILGWTRHGPRAASFASKLQAALGPVYARSIRATAQSAAMGGYGAQAAHRITKAGAALSGMLTGSWNFWNPEDSQKEHGKDGRLKKEL